MEQSVRFMYPVSKGRYLLVYNTGLLSLFTPETNQVEFFSNDSLRENSTYFAAANMPNFLVLYDSKGELYYLPSSYPIYKLNEKEFIPIPGTMNGGLQGAGIDSKDNLYFSDEKTVKFFNTRDSLINVQKIDLPTKGQRILGLNTDQQDNLWISLDSFIIGYKTSSQQLFHRSENSSEKILNLKPGPARSIYPVKNGVWFLRNNYVLSYFNNHLNQMVHFTHDPTYQNSPLETFNFMSISNNLGFFESRNGVCFFLGESGISYVDLENAQFPSIKLPIRSTTHANNSTIHGIHASGQNRIWIGNENGLYLFDRERNKFYYYPGFDGNINAIHVRKGGTELWIGSTQLSVHQFNPKNYQLNKIHEFVPTLNDTTSLPGWFVTKIYSDKEDQLWICTGDGIGKYIPSKDEKLPGTFKQFKPIPGNTESLAHKMVWDIVEASDNTYWICTNSGLSRFDPLAEKFTNYFSNDTIGSLATNNVKTAIEDNKNRIWIGTEGNGICLFIPENNSFVNYTKENGMPSNSVYGIVADNEGNIWLSTSNGISKFDPDNIKFENYTMADGLPTDLFNILSYAYNDITNEILFGSNKGFVLFNPDKIEKSDFCPELYITKLQIRNKTVHTGKWNKNREILTKAIWETESIVLNHNENNLHINFATLDYSSPECIRYKFTLEGYQDIWHSPSGNLNTATYMNLPPGKYIFRVKSTNGDGIWVNNEKFLNIKILAPWWKTLWFKLILFTFLVGISLLFYFSRIYALKRQKILLKERVDRRTKSLKEANEKLEYQKNEIISQKEKLIEAEEQKLQFFTSISHELKTPLTVISGVSEKYLNKTLLNKMKEGDVEMIHRNASQLLELINQMLDIRRIDKHSFTLKVQKIPPQPFFKAITDAYREFSEICKIKLNLNTEKAQSDCWVDTGIVNKIVSNLISNAIKFTPDNGVVTVTVRSTENNLEIAVEDTGRGIPHSHLERIFDRFYQDNNNEFRRFESSGIGLSLVNELVKLHHGIIKVQSVPNKGSIFEVSLPASKDFYSTEEISTDLSDFSVPEINKSIVSFAKNNYQNNQSKKYGGSQLSEEQNSLVLIVEDSTDLREFLKDLLQRKHKILTANNGKDGLDIALKYIPDIIITDIMMPQMDGIQLTKLLKENIATCHIPVIQLTARSSNQYQFEGLQAGADDYITKPFNANSLFQKVNNILETRRKLQLKLNSYFQSEQIPEETSNVNEEFIKKLIILITENITDPKLDGNFLAKKLALGKTTLYRKLHALTGTSVNIFIRKIRLKKAKELLTKKSFNISEVGYMVGFNNHSYFTKCFTEEYGSSPLDYLKKGAV